MVYYNSDGSQGEMCGNGIRCFSKFVFEKGLVRKTEFNVETLAGIKKITLTLDEQGLVKRISVGMGKPLFPAESVPTTLPGNPVMMEPLDVDGQLVLFTAMRLGVPHGVIVCEDLDQVDINGLGRKIEIHPAFPEKINANFMQVVDREHIRVKTFERGAGRTLACGTGCCSSVVAGNLLGLLEPKVTVQAEGGVLEIALGDDYEVTMAGSAEMICEGEFSPWVMQQIENFSK
jgi:diaminopimelate epimerase